MAEGFLGDALGSVRQLVDEGGEVLLARAYAPYGETQMEIPQSPNAQITPYGFTGEWTDATGLVYLRARYYSPWQGRFLSRDGWGGDVNQPVSYNKWLYGYGNPVNRVDPQGLFPCSVCPYVSSGWAYKMCMKYCCDEDTPMPVPHSDIYNLSAYYVTHETQFYSGSGSSSRAIPSLGGITANKYFLFSSEGVCMQGSGQLKDGRYIGCVSPMTWTETEVIGQWTYIMPPDQPEYRENIPFFWKSEADFKHLIPFETVAVCHDGVIPRGSKICIPGIMKAIEAEAEEMQRSELKSAVEGKDDIFTVTDTGGALCSRHAIDIFVGYQGPWSGRLSVASLAYQAIMKLPDMKVEW